jgi:hypothetical protein
MSSSKAKTSRMKQTVIEPIRFPAEVHASVQSVQSSAVPRAQNSPV